VDICKKEMYGSGFPLRGSVLLRDGMEMEMMDLSSTDDDLRDAMAWRVPWRGVAWHAMAFMIAIQDSRSPKTNTT
jgi:hypothetical protein